MDDTKLTMLQYYLDTLEYPTGITRQQQRYIDSQSKHYFVYNDRLYRRDKDNNPRLVLTKQEANNAIYFHHFHPMGGHFLFLNTYHKIARRYYWEGMKKDIQDAISRCDHCQKQGKPTLNESLHPIPVEPTPWSRVVLDIKHFRPSRKGNRYVVAAIDAFTKTVEAKALRYANSTEISIFLYEDVICRHGCPSVIITDNGLPFANKLVEEVCKQFSIEWRRGSFYHPESQGIIERFHRSLGQLLKKRPIEEKDDWCSYLAASVFAYHKIVQNTVKVSPFKLLYGVEARTPFDNTIESSNTTEEWSEEQLSRRVEKQLELLQNIRKNADASIKISQKNQKAIIEKKILEKKKHLIQPPFEIGNTVHVFKSMVQTSFSGKIDETWDGPFIVVEKNNKSGYKLASMKGEPLKGTVHGNRLRSYKLPNVQFRPSFTSSNPITDHLNLLQDIENMNTNQNNDLENWIIPEASNRNSNSVVDDEFIYIDFILNGPSATKPTSQEPTAETTRDPRSTNIQPLEIEGGARSLENFVYLSTTLQLSPYTQSLIQELSWYEAYRANTKKNRDEVIKCIANEIAGSDNLVKFIDGRFAKGTKQILEANGISSTEMLNPENQFRRRLAKELKRKLN
ncbi:hypothetical protein INT45_003865 [Circinella minor]|uniref:Integrase catalytic domain-containing protein n=1 Tax=Circinella minor TaxID=1195481 RepID=A0A8H7VNG0_9FUNG|nr:hypothetical protein INT45_003865 [Circinella minor]